MYFQVKKTSKKAKLRTTAAKSKIKKVKPSPAPEVSEMLQNSQDAPENPTCINAENSDIDSQYANLDAMDAEDAPSDVPPLERTDSIILSQDYLDTFGKVPDSEEESSIITVSSGSKYSPSKHSLQEESTEESGKVSDTIVEADKSKKVKIKKYRKRKVPSACAKEGVTECDSPSDEPEKKRMNVSIMKLQKKNDGA